MPKKMLILRGNHGWREDERGEKHNYKDGALHEPAAKEYARRLGYEGVVLKVSGNPPDDGGKRDHSPQTFRALAAFRKDKAITALYGFSGGGYNICWMLQVLKKDELKRPERVVVLGRRKPSPRRMTHPAIRRAIGSSSTKPIRIQPIRSCRKASKIVVLGAPETKESAYDKSNYPGAHWELVYKLDPLKTAKGVPKGIKDPHMFGPEALLAQTPDPNQKTP